MHLQLANQQFAGRHSASGFCDHYRLDRKGWDARAQVFVDAGIDETLLTAEERANGVDVAAIGSCTPTPRYTLTSSGLVPRQAQSWRRPPSCRECLTFSRHNSNFQQAGAVLVGRMRALVPPHCGRTQKRKPQVRSQGTVLDAGPGMCCMRYTPMRCRPSTAMHSSAYSTLCPRHRLLLSRPHVHHGATERAAGLTADELSDMFA